MVRRARLAGAGGPLRERVPKSLSEDPARRALLFVAVELGRFPHEVDALPCGEFDELLAFFRLRTEEEQKRMKESQKGSGGNTRSARPTAPRRR
jgi:hypothetical protein